MVCTTQADAELDTVSAGYTGRPVLHDVSVRFPHGRITALVGANGSGKSTVLGVLAGLLRPVAGTVRAPRRPALVAQHTAVPTLLPLTVRDTVNMGRWAARGGPWRRLSRHDRDVVDRCLSLLGIGDLATRTLSALSGGQRQRTLVAQALAQESTLLLLDEPTSALDTSASAAILRALGDARAEGTTVVHATHDLAQARQADHCVVLRQGTVFAAGSPEAVLSPDVLHAAWGLSGPGEAG
ncbi:zinc ABC transporter ATP-binding protein AztA [Saccharomonospora cyanea]|uniref:ATPase component of Mn/Zn ABC-type transporter n=1 Tax=Saccharomonospora cyanea NA-134 TaxID=882082 RepID=H5XJY1_9PSEU|nr:zinc ABC transporter ATP-binding protein AztA [Saccharomonospora cyanea]EHR61898.1 ATPase component of Mn/Zn ABC-type transporter [Saccharomonospora cyanea NA-134]